MTLIPNKVYYGPADAHRVTCPSCKDRIVIDVSPKAAVHVEKDETAPKSEPAKSVPRKISVGVTTKPSWSMPPSYWPSSYAYGGMVNPWHKWTTSLDEIRDREIIRQQQQIEGLNRQLELQARQIADLQKNATAYAFKEDVIKLDKSCVSAHKRITAYHTEVTRLIRETVGDINLRMEGIKSKLRKEIDTVWRIITWNAKAFNYLAKRYWSFSITPPIELTKRKEFVAKLEPDPDPTLAPSPENYKPYPKPKPDIYLDKELVQAIRMKTLEAMINCPMGAVSFELTQELCDAMDKAINKAIVDNCEFCD